MLLLTKYWIAPRAQRFLRWDEAGISMVKHFYVSLQIGEDDEATSGTSDSPSTFKTTKLNKNEL